MSPSLKIVNIGQLATFDPGSGSVEKMDRLEIAIEKGRVVEMAEKLPPADDELDAGGRLVTPGWVDPHTHPVFARTREDEFAMRVAGESYEEIAAAGGGIKASVQALREIDEERLTALVRQRLQGFLSHGTTTIEAKSGYGLSTESELKSLRVLRRAAREAHTEVVPTFLGAHDFPQEYIQDTRAYVDLVCQEMIPAVDRENMAEYCDVFCEKGWFSVADARRILTVAREHGLKLRLHADEFQDSGAASLAAELKAHSADHLAHISDNAIEQMAESGTVAVLLPGTTFFLGRRDYAPARKLMEAGIPVALGSDFNPGSSMIQSMSFIVSLACLYLGMSLDEAFAAATYQAARSLDRHDVVGSVRPGMQADLIIWNLTSLTEIPYHVATSRVGRVIKSGRVAFSLDNNGHRR
ncbi:MAG: imidazolonepropionase [Fidelibacterota bacterium]